MARRPNYKFERMERDRAKAAKKAARAQLKAEKAEKRKAEASGESLPGELPAEEASADGASVEEPPPENQ